ncbi:hypothetical protein TPHA_0B03290 [Tetrapisispora phaffii CBS 4417]|uniref:RING-type domain-containing protein n=1 Tax=Tetrapisispora phaffii (strain ATCC 24235 / CBS 4417 / NBRC 1672 / NRRL Y-8282 / UCD 70-5) TaxID=1071381 RepID=G8BPS0_TETPH|nr:hypothetical protein TPHA_0B03290 [Tetrapisispora phaffii CBS 4417]CCE62001.1 hypothetical protein TPHA_0B03290 [Tetrapisispora phaffii CBS 4417]
MISTLVPLENEQVIHQYINVETGEASTHLKTPESQTFLHSMEKISPSSFIKNKNWKFGFNKPKKYDRKEKIKHPVEFENSTKRKPPPLPKLNELSPLKAFPERQSSLPRPSSILFNPKKEHLSYSSTSGTISGTVNSSKKSNSLTNLSSELQKPHNSNSEGHRNKKSFINATCTLCNEFVSNRAPGEKIIELTCGHPIHEDCLTISFGNSSDYDVNNNYSLFPKCQSCLLANKSSKRCIPVSEEIKDKLMSNFLLNNSMSPIEQSIEIDSQMVNETMSAKLSPIQRLEKIHKFPNSRTSSPISLFTRANDSRLSGLDGLPFVKPIGVLPVNTVLDNKKSRIGSTIYASPQIISSNLETQSLHSVETLDAQENYVESEQSDNSIPILRSFFTESLLSDFPDKLKKSQFDEDHGLLRLVDTFSTSFNGTEYSAGNCFLFEKSIILSKSSKSNEDTASHILATSNDNFGNVTVFNLGEGFVIETIDSSVLKIKFSAETNPVSSYLYLTENLKTNTSSIIEKWISGLLDLTFTFNCKHFTSTLELPPVLKNSDADTSNATFFALVNNNKIVEVTHLDNESTGTILRRSVCMPTTGTTDFTVDSLMSVVTSFSSIISMKMKKPENLLLVVQIDFRKLNQGEELVIKNTIRALTLNYSDLHMCFVDNHSKVIKIVPTKDIVNGTDYFKDLSQIKGSTSFSPSWLLSELYPDGVKTSLGVSVISNTKMDETESILFMDFDKFNGLGRKKVHQLKVHVGFLNIDYSEEIQELLEINNWNLLLESLCFTFDIVYGQDEDTVDFAINKNNTISRSTTPTLLLDPNDSASDLESLTTILLGTATPSTRDSPLTISS